MKTIIISAIVFTLGLYAGIYIKNAPRKTERIQVGDCVKMKTSEVPFQYRVSKINETDAELEISPELFLVYPLNELEKTECSE